MTRTQALTSVRLRMSAYRMRGKDEKEMDLITHARDYSWMVLIVILDELIEKAWDKYVSYSYSCHVTLPYFQELPIHGRTRELSMQGCRESPWKLIGHVYYFDL